MEEILHRLGRIKPRKEWNIDQQLNWWVFRLPEFSGCHQPVSFSLRKTSIPSDNAIGSRAILFLAPISGSCPSFTCCCITSTTTSNLEVPTNRSTLGWPLVFGEFFGFNRIYEREILKNLTDLSLKKSPKNPNWVDKFSLGGVGGGSIGGGGLGFLKMCSNHLDVSSPNFGMQNHDTLPRN